MKWRGTETLQDFVIVLRIPSCICHYRSPVESPPAKKSPECNFGKRILPPMQIDHDQGLFNRQGRTRYCSQRKILQMWRASGSLGRESEFIKRETWGGFEIFKTSDIVGNILHSWNFSQVRRVARSTLFSYWPKLGVLINWQRRCSSRNWAA